MFSTDKRSQLVAVLIAGIDQLKNLLDALNLISPEPTDKRLIAGAKAHLTNAQENLNQLYK
jgi:hypothetical protein